MIRYAREINKNTRSIPPPNRWESCSFFSRFVSTRKTLYLEQPFGEAKNSRPQCPRRASSVPFRSRRFAFVPD